MGALGRAFPSLPCVVVGDIHINVRDGHLDFEVKRIKSLAEELNKVLSGHLLVLAGDIFDKNRPSLEEVKIFYDLIESTKNTAENIIVISGNHDKDTFKFLPAINFTYLDSPKVLYDILFVPWSSIQHFTESLKGSPTIYPRLLISHARCTINDFIKEEVDIGLLSKSFDKVILGDIHHFMHPYPNVVYTSSPSNTTFTAVKEGTNGFVTVDPRLNITEIPISIPRRELISINSTSSMAKVVLAPSNLYKVRISDTLENLQKFSKHKYKNVKFDLIPTVEAGKNDYGYKEQLVRSPYDHLVSYMQKFRFSESTIISSVNRLKSYSKGK